MKTSRQTTGYLVGLAAVLGGLLPATVAPLAAQDFADVKMVFKYDGKPPAPAAVAVTKDQAFCGKKKLVDEALLVDAKTKGIANVIAYIYVRGAANKPPVHPSFAKTAKAEVKLANTGCRFEPRMVLLRSTQTLLVQNPDSVGHNTKMDPIDQVKNPGQNFNLPAGSTLKHKFNAAESFPAFPVSCSIHPWMKAWVVLKDSPYMGVSSKQGEMVIPKVPVGEWSFRLWQEAAGNVRNVPGKLGSKAIKTDRRGRIKVKVPKEGITLTFNLPAKLFKR